MMKKILECLANRQYFKGRLRKWLLILFDIFCFVVADAVYFFLSEQASFSTPVSEYDTYIYNSIILLVWLFLFRFIFKVYFNELRCTDTKVYFKMVISDGIGAVSTVFFSRFVMTSLVPGFYIGIWHGVTVTSLSLLLTLLSRFIYRLICESLNRKEHQRESNIEKTNVAITGAGQLGMGLAKELKENPSDTEDKTLVRDFTIEDLLFRQPIEMDEKLVCDYYTDKTVIVTGGGGSIGSELCRQIAKCLPEKLIIFDIYENNAYDIQQELTRKYPELDLCVEIGSVRDVDRLDCVFAHYRPDVVFHAAAHKHVPLMEHSNAEAVKNNVFGTYNTANAAEKYGVEKFILVSTDKAVNPTNVMGASKRMCEMLIQCRIDSKTSFAAVRFGNVLGSNGSVIPLFKRQIAEGGPVTIADKRIVRYFMTIPEASSLVLTAGAMAEKGELFVLDMGKPVKIYDLAMNVIRLMGYEPGIDIEVKEMGLRPGEKLYEELLIKTEDLSKTENDMIFIEKDTPYTRAQVEEKLVILKNAVESAKNEIAAVSVKAAMKQVVPTFFEPDEINKKAQDAEEMKLTDDNSIK